MPWWRLILTWLWYKFRWARTLLKTSCWMEDLMWIMINELRNWLKLPNFKLVVYTLWMANQTITKVIGLIKDLKIHIHVIPYIATFIVMNNSVLDSSYSMLLGWPWLCNARVIHDWGNNIITIESHGMV